MPRHKTRTLTEFELEIMRIIWERGELTVPELQILLKEKNRDVALPTVRTMLGILEEKGYLARRTGRRRHVFHATISANSAHRGLLKDIIDRAFDGSALGLVAALVNGKMVSRSDLQKVEELISRREKEGQK